MSEQYLTVKEAAAQMRVTRQAVYNWITAGRIQAVKFGSSVRIPLSAWEAFIKEATTAPSDRRAA